MATGAKARRQAEADAAAILADASQRAGVILREAEAHAADEAARVREEALQDAKRIREDAVEEIVKLMSTLTTERDHILADARDDARRIIESAREEGEATAPEVDASTSSAPAEPPPETHAAQGHVASRSELDELYFSGAPEPAPLAQPRPFQRRRRKRFLRRQ